MAKLNKLTARQVESIKRAGVHSDGGGLFLRVRGTRRSWIFVYQWLGRRRELGLGAPPAIGLAKARARAQAARELLADEVDPIAAKRADRAIPEFGTLADEWVAARTSSVRNPKSIDRWCRTLGEGGYAKALRSIRVDRITTADVLGVLKPIWPKGPTATLARSYIEAVLNAAKAKGLRRGENPAAWRGHLDHLLPRPNKLARGHHAAMPYGEVPEFMGRLRERSTATARLVEFTVLTAARSGEVLGAVWGEVDLERAVWTIPAVRMKAGREHRVPLSKRAVAILNERQSDNLGPASPLFSERGRPLSNMAATMLLRRMEVGVTVHGFRSSFRDFAGDQTSFPREVAEQALAHSLGAVEAAYRRADALDKRRRLMEAWADFCDQSKQVTRSAAKLGGDLVQRPADRKAR